MCADTTKRSATICQTKVTHCIRAHTFDSSMQPQRRRQHALLSRTVDDATVTRTKTTTTTTMSTLIRKACMRTLRCMQSAFQPHAIAINIGCWLVHHHERFTLCGRRDSRIIEPLAGACSAPERGAAHLVRRSPLLFLDNKSIGECAAHRARVTHSALCTAHRNRIHTHTNTHTWVDSGYVNAMRCAVCTHEETTRKWCW